MKLRTVALILLLCVTLIPPTNAQPPPSGPGSSNGACARAAIAGTVGGDFQAVAVNVNGNTPSACVGAKNVVFLEAGSSFTMTCLHESSGTLDPPAPTTVNVRLVSDNTNFGSNTPTAIRTIAANQCATGTGSTSVGTGACTTTGAVGGAAAYGVIRIQVEIAQSSGVQNYDINSDNAAVGDGFRFPGIIVCTVGLTSEAESNAQTTYIGGDTIGLSYQVNATPFDSTNSGNGQIVCASVTNSLAADSPTTAIKSKTTTILGAPSVWAPSCNLQFSWLFTRFSAVPTFTNTYWTSFTGTPPTGITFTTTTISSITYNTGAQITATKPLNRILTPAVSCTVQVNGVTSTIGNRGDSFLTNQCGWQDARGANVPNNQPGRGWLQIAGAYRATADFPSFDGLWSASGHFQTTMTATTTATVTTGLGYHKMVEEFSTTARTDAVLMNWGNTSGLLDVSATWHFTNIHNSKTAGGTNVSSFTIGADLEFVQPQGLQDINNVAKSGIAVSCNRLKPDQSVESTTSFGTTGVSGNANEVQTAPLSPQGNWKFVCTASGSGNSVSFTITFQYVSAFTADQSQAVGWNVTVPVLSNGTLLANVSVIFRAYDPTTDMPITTFPDDPSDVKLNVECYNTSTGRYSDSIVLRQRMIKNDGAQSTSWSWPFYANQTQLHLGCVAFVNANLTARPFLSSEYYILPIAYNGTFYGDGGNITNITAGSSLTPDQQATVQDMTTFFSTPTTMLLPLFLMMAASLFFFMRTENKITSFFFAMIDLVFAFSVVAAKPTLDSIGSIYAFLGVLFFFGMAILTLVKAWTAPVAPDG